MIDYRVIKRMENGYAGHVDIGRCRNLIPCTALVTGLRVCLIRQIPGDPVLSGTALIGSYYIRKNTLRDGERRRRVFDVH